MSRALLTLLLLVSLLLTACCNSAFTTVLAEQWPIRFIRTVQVTPDAQFLTGSFARINYVPATDHFVVSFGTKASTEPNVTLGAGYAYKEYTVEMQEAGRTGLLTWYPNSSEAGDSGSVMVNNTYYYAFVPQGYPPGSESYRWQLVKYDAANWTRLKEVSVPLPDPNEATLDPMVASVNDQLMVSDQFNPSGIWQDGNSTQHHFFSEDLEPIGIMTLADSPHIGGSSIVFVDGVYYFVSATDFAGGLVVMKYDSEWRYLGMKALISEAHFSTGTVFDGQHFYVAYLDTSQRTPLTLFPIYPNVHLAVFDREWNLMFDEAVTNFTLADDHKGGRPWVMLHGNRLYVSYDVDSVNKTTETEELKWQAYVSIYEIAPADVSAPVVGTPSLSPSRNSVQPYQNVKVSANVTDLESGVKNVTLLYSLDNGTTWENPESMNLNNTSGLYEGTIPGQSIGTVVRFNIVAFDNAENSVRKDGTTSTLTYTVVPEFLPTIALYVFIITTLLSTIIYRRKKPIPETKARSVKRKN